MVADLPAGATGYVSYADLASLPQITVRAAGDENFSATPRSTITGVSLAVLAQAVGALPSSDLIDALCTDRYRAHYPAGYLAAHHPVLGLEVDRQRPEVWAKKTGQYDPGPYFVTHAKYSPSYRILAHEDQAQIPTNVVRLNFSTVSATFGAIAPSGPTMQQEPVRQGFVIAQQNCLRCHFQGVYGGTKSGRDWTTLSTWAREQPAFFARYVHDPKSLEPHANMPPNPSYDQATLAALTAYFRSFPAERVPRQP